MASNMTKESFSQDCILALVYLKKKKKKVFQRPKDHIYIIAIDLQIIIFSFCLSEYVALS